MAHRAAPAVAAWAKWLVVGTCVALVAYVVLVPLAFLLWQSVHSSTTDRFSLANFYAVYAGAGTARLVSDSLRFAAGASLIAFAVGTLLAWLNERTNAPFKRLCFALSIVPLIIPGVTLAG